MVGAPWADGNAPVSGSAYVASMLTSILSPVAGPLHICTDPNDIPDCPFSPNAWEFWQHKTGFHGGESPHCGIACSDDTFAWDVNLNGEPADRGKPVFAVAKGKVVKYAGDRKPGGCSGAVLIEHELGGSK